jgi:hypothetical protein
MNESSKPRFCGFDLSAIARLGLGIALALVGGCTKADPHPEETAALKTLIDDYKLEKHEKDSEGRVNILKLEGPQFDDSALVHAGKFPELRRLSVWKSAITDAGLEKLPVLKNLTNMNIIANGITDRGLLALRKQPSLKDVWLVETERVTAAGMASLKKTNPGVRLHVMNKPKNKTAKQS